MDEDKNVQTDADLSSDQGEQENQDNQEIESQEDQNDPADKMSPDHPRFKEVLRERNEYREELSSLKEEIAEMKKQLSTKTDNDDDIDADEELALDKIARGLKQKGLLVTTEDLNAERRALKLEKLTDKFSGKKGYPKFDSLSVVSYAKRNGFGENYEAAYRDMHNDAILEAEVSARKTIKVPESEKSTHEGVKVNNNTVSPEDISKMSLEDYAKHREALLRSIKPRVE